MQETLTPSLRVFHVWLLILFVPFKKAESSANAYVIIETEEYYRNTTGSSVSVSSLTMEMKLLRSIYATI